ncbi:helix-turn-helix domain-containing protein [Thermus tengchongensis]|uniref:DNA-binding protein n=1 Tax=Thermus tengchongensis TaxID=1214928 RepID=A0ABY2K3T5_9DEIN|nr:helix-turn-helix domain-containing protein [Thermus tengchongensis]TFU14691.1 DNA-binding protein [Thermus tengchongensis]
MPGELLTTEEVAKRLKISVFFVRRKIREGALPAIKLGKEWRVREEDLDLFLARFSKSPLADTAKEAK